LMYIIHITAFESVSRFSPIAAGVSCETELLEIVSLASVRVLCLKCFAQCKSLSSITFEPNSRLREIDRTVFSGGSLVPTLLMTRWSHWWCNSGQWTTWKAISSSLYCPRSAAEKQSIDILHGCQWLWVESFGDNGGRPIL
jgi:hypothetical protein